MEPSIRHSRCGSYATEILALGQLARVADDHVEVVTHAQVEVQEVASPFVEHRLRCPDPLFATFRESLEERIHVGPDSRGWHPGICSDASARVSNSSAAASSLAGRSPTHTATS